MVRVIKPIRFTMAIITGLSLLLWGGYEAYQTSKDMLGLSDSNLQRIATISIERNEDENNSQLAIAFQGNVVVYNDNRIRAYDINGQELWSREQKIQSPLLKNSKDMLILADQETGLINAMNSQGEVLWTVNIDSPIADFANNLQGKSAVVIQDGQAGGIINIFDELGKATGKVEIDESAIMAINISEDGEMMAASLLSVENNKIETNVVLYSMTGRLLGGNKYDNEIMSKLFYDTENNLIAVGTDHVVCFDKEKGLLWSKSIPHSINKLSWNNENLLALNLVNERKSVVNTENTIMIIAKDGTIVYEAPIKDSIKAMDSMGSKVIVAGNRTLYYIDSELDKLVEKKINSDIEGIQFISEEQLMVTAKEKIEIIKLQ